jgi:hypothetical protein
LFAQVFGKIIICSYQNAEIELQNPNLRVLSAIDEIGIEIIDNFLTEKFKKFLYYQWVQQFVVPHFYAPCPKKGRF